MAAPGAPQVLGKPGRGDGAKPVPQGPPGRWPELASIARDRGFWLALLVGPPVAWVAVAALGFGKPLARLPLSALAWLVLMGPLLEEIVFRGLIQGLLSGCVVGRYALGPVTVANGLTTVCFSLAHYPRGTWELAGLVVMPGLVFGLLRDRHGGIVSPMLLHSWYNACLAMAAWATAG